MGKFNPIPITSVETNTSVNPFLKLSDCAILVSSGKSPYKMDTLYPSSFNKSAYCNTLFLEKVTKQSPD